MDYTGGKYEGDVGSGRFDGHGTYSFPDGSKYVGQFKHGMFHGKGTIHNSVGSYAGVWDYGKVSALYAACVVGSLPLLTPVWLVRKYSW